MAVSCLLLNSRPLPSSHWLYYFDSRKDIHSSGLRLLERHNYSEKFFRSGASLVGMVQQASQKLYLDCTVVEFLEIVN